MFLMLSSFFLSFFLFVFQANLVFKKDNPLFLFSLSNVLRFLFTVALPPKRNAKIEKISGQKNKNFKIGV